MVDDFSALLTAARQDELFFSSNFQAKNMKTENNQFWNKHTKLCDENQKHEINSLLYLF